jgi:putative SOS response-associated peptidase YedK
MQAASSDEVWTPGPASAPIEAAHDLFGFLVIEANANVSPISPKAMPVILTMPAEVDRWLGADTPDARVETLARLRALSSAARGEM